MSFRKPFQSTPPTLGPVYAARKRRAERKYVARVLSIAAAVGALIGAASLAIPTSAPVKDEIVRSFTLCHTGGGTNCVVDGDTIWLDGQKIRIADIDAPETHPSRCDREAELGRRATERLHVLVNAGPFTVATLGRATDRYGRKLRVLTREGRSLGDLLVAEGLARTWTGRREPWC
ncbi:MAG: nuclease [Sphingobium sp. 32-64-5]|nr:MAG: nuclease [Sphingobium sp. 32-64-5]